MGATTDVPDGFSIGELSRRTGVPQATLRTWEQRYGQPEALPRSGGHRRYDASAVRAVETILNRRGSGMTMEAAVASVSGAAGAGDVSVFATLRREYPELAPQRLRKRTLLLLTRALEDEHLARSGRTVLFGGFQEARHYAASRHRWLEMSRTADAAYVLAEALEAGVDESLVRVPLPAEAPLRREWVVVCDGQDGDDYPACLAAWELPGPPGPDADRTFEMVWSLDPAVVRLAARTCLQIVTTYAPSVDPDVAQRLATTPPKASTDLRRATVLLQRVMTYLDADR